MIDEVHVFVSGANWRRIGSSATSRIRDGHLYYGNRPNATSHCGADGDRRIRASGLSSRVRRWRSMAMTSTFLKRRRRKRRPGRAPELLRDSYESGRTRPSPTARSSSTDWRGSSRNASATSSRRSTKTWAGPSFEVYPSEIALIVAELALARKKLGSWTKPERVPTAMAVPARAKLDLSRAAGRRADHRAVELPASARALAAGRCDRRRELRDRQAERARPGHQPLDRQRDCRNIWIPTACRSSKGAPRKRRRCSRSDSTHIFYTGGETVGRIVMQAAAKHLTPVTLELGGKSPCIVDRHTDLDVAARRIVWGKFYNAGQTCVAPDYVLAHKEIEEPLLAQMKQTLHDFFGDDPHAGAGLRPDHQRPALRAADEAARRQRRDRRRRHRDPADDVYRSDDPHERAERCPGHGRARSSGRSCRCSRSRTSTMRSRS